MKPNKKTDIRNVIAYPAEKLDVLLHAHKDKSSRLGFDGRLRGISAQDQSFRALAGVKNIVVNLVARRSARGKMHTIVLLIKANSLWPCLRLYNRKSQLDLRTMLGSERYPDWLIAWEDFVAMLDQFNVTLLVVDNKSQLATKMHKACGSRSGLEEKRYHKRVQVVSRSRHNLGKPPKRGRPWTTRKPIDKDQLIKTGGYFITPI